jgi:PAS domain S-box-containing protein
MDERAYRTIFEASPDSMWIFDESTLKFLDVNDAAVRTYGYTRDEFLAIGLKEIRPLCEVPALLASMRPEGESGQNIWTHRKKSGEEILVTVFSTPTVFAGVPARAVVIRDVTEQHQSRQALGVANMALTAILSASPACILSVDFEGKIETWNPATAKLIGMTLTEARGRFAWEVFGIEKAAFGTTLDAVMAGKTVEGIEVTTPSADGGVHYLLLSAAPLFADNGTVTGAMAVLVDNTESVRVHRDLEAWSELLERRVSERTTELVAANEELEGFCASVSHDLRSPLRAIDGFSRAILEDYGEALDDEGKDYLNRVRAASWRMSDLIDDLLGLTRLTRTPLNRNLVDLAKLANATIAELRAAHEDRSVEYVGFDSAVVYGDPRLLGILLTALLENAWKFTSKVDHARIEFSIEKEGSETIYVIRDNGAGFDMSYVRKLFKPFERLHRAVEFPGNGIGLATAHRIVSKHGGRIWADGFPGHGTTIRFTLDSMGPSD